MREKVAILGGDIRQLTVADFLIDRGFEVVVWGINMANENEKYNYNYSLDSALEGVTTCILPLPVSTDSIRLNMPLYEGEWIKISDLLSSLKKGMKVYVGKATSEFKDGCEDKGIKLVDYFDNECLCIKNALLTSEAAIDIVMRELPFTLDSSKIMVIGYGRIGKFLSGLLLKMNSSVTVAARKYTDLAYAECMGCDTLYIDQTKEFKNLLSINDGYDVVFNTVPCCLFDRNVLEHLNKNVVIIDLASPPGGTDIRAAKEIGIKVIWALSLPGKYSPHRAGRIIAETIYEDLEVTEI